MIKHLNDPSKHKQIEMIDDEDGRQIEWEGLPTSLIMTIEQDYDMVKAYPLMCLNMAIQEEKESIEGLRPYEEIKKHIDESIELKETNPADEYERQEMIGQGGFGEVFKVKRKADDVLFAMKVVKDVAAAEK